MYKSEIILPNEPRDYQIDGFNKIISTHSNTLVVAPTSAGKTTIMLMLAKYFIETGKRVLISVQMLIILDELIKQCKQSGFTFGVVQGIHELTDVSANLQLASNSTFIRRDTGIYDVIIQDELHILPEKLFNYYKDSKAQIIGFTATPFRRNLDKLFPDLINLVTAKELTKRGLMSPLKIISGTKIDHNKLTKDSYGEYSAQSIEDATGEILGDTVKLWLEHAYMKQTLVFASSISHANLISNKFNESGINSAVYCANTLKSDKELLLDKFKTGEIKILCSVSAIATGMDIPSATCMIDLRPLRKSLSTLIQSIGRVLRIFPNKDCALLLDCTGNIKRFANDYLDWFMNGVEKLKDVEKKDKIARDKQLHKKKEDKESKPCPQCQSIMWLQRHCMACGYVIPVEPGKIEHITKDVEFREFKLFDSRPNKTNNNLWVEISNFVYYKYEDKNMALKRAKAIYKSCTGNWPEYTQKLKPDPTIPISKLLIREIDKQTQNYIKSMRR